MQKRLVLLLVFVCIVFLWLNRSRAIEGFKAAANAVQKSPPMTAKDAKEMFDEYIISYVKEYQLLSEMKSKDIRVENMMKLMADDINNLNRDYPSFVEKNQGFPWSSFPMITQNDMKILKDFAIRTVGQVDSKKPLEPATVADLDLFINRLQSLHLFITNKFTLLPRQTRDTFETQFKNLNETIMTCIKYTQEFKKTVGSMKPSNIPVLKRFNYMNMFTLAPGKFMWPPELASKPTGPIQTANLPIPKSGVNGLANALQQSTTATSSGTAPICPPPAKPCPVPPKGKKYSETVRDLLIENALVKAYGGTYLY
jgi:hypothetical protein